MVEWADISKYMGSGSGESLWGFFLDILLYAGAGLVIVWLGWKILGRYVFNHYVTIWKETASGVDRVLYDRIQIKKRKNEPEVWKIINQKRILNFIVPNDLIAYGPKGKGHIELFEDKEGNLYPARPVREMTTTIKKEDGTEHRIRTPIIVPELREWKEGYAQYVRQSNERLRQNPFKAIVITSVIVIAVVGIIIAIMIKMNGTLIKGG